VDNEAIKWALQTIASAHVCIPSILDITLSISNRGGAGARREGDVFYGNMVLIVPTFLRPPDFKPARGPKKSHKKT